MLDSVLIYLNKAKFYYNQYCNEESTRNNYFFGYYYLKIKDLDNAKKHFYISRNANNDGVFYERSTNELIKILAIEKKFKELYILQNELDTKKYFLNIKNENKYQIDRFKYEKKKKASQLEIENKNQLVNNEIKLNNQRLIFKIIILLFIIISIATYFLWKNYKKVNQYHQLLFESNKEINKKEQSIAEQNQELLQLNKTKDYFFSFIAYDLQNPFKNILQLTIESINPKSNKELLLKQINSTAIAAQMLLENTNEWIKLQSKNYNIKSEEIDLQQAINNNISLFQNLIDLKNITFTNEILTGELLIADAASTNIIFKNLFYNLLQSVNSNCRFRASLTHNFENKIIYFNMDYSEDLKKLLLLFNHQNDKAINLTSTSDLGITICKELIEKNGGKIRVDNQENNILIVELIFPKEITRFNDPMN